MISTNFSHTAPSTGPVQAAAHRRTAQITAPPRGFTLVEMLIAISITLVMMATVVGVFATVSNSVQNRRSAIEVGGQLRHVRNVLQRDLAGATCPALPWQKPESNVGYFEIVEGLHADFYPSLLTDGQPVSANNPEIDHAVSTIPSSNLQLPQGWVTDGGGLGDHDDILAFTSRNEKEPFTGPAPAGNVMNPGTDNSPNPFAAWNSQTITSPVAEVVWFCVENPAVDTAGYFGNQGLAGFRTIYRRTLLVAPWLDYRYNVDGQPKSRPGVLRIINRPNVTEAQALAALIAFQERFDISARIEFDPTISAPDGRWVIRANTLADLTDRKNRYEHHGFAGLPSAGSRNFPYVMMSAGGQPPSNVQFVVDPAITPPTSNAQATPVRDNHATLEPIAGYVVPPNSRGGGYFNRPLAVLDGGATARAIVNEAGQVVHVTTGLAPLGRTGLNTSRRGEDLMMSDALAFDVQVFDPEASVYSLRPNGVPLRNGDSELQPGNAANLAQLDLTTVGPADLGWVRAAADGGNPFVASNGAYVDLGFRELHREVQRRLGNSVNLLSTSTFAGLPHPKSLLNDARLTRVYDTWNFAYENDGIDQDNDGLVDEGTNGFDDPGFYSDNPNATRLGVDDPGERETSPPYPYPLRAVQIKLRVYEADSRQIREVTVRQHFVPE